MTDWSFIHAVPFFELTALLVLAAGVGFIGLLLRQPMVVSFLAVGVIAGPSVLDIVQSPDNVELLAELGVALLLFLVGMKLDLSLIRSLGVVSLATGLGQVLFTSVIGFFIGLLLGLPPVPALYVAVALTFSSTIIIVKLLSDKKEVDSLYGRIAIGFLIVQDLVVVLAMMVLSAFGVGMRDGSGNWYAQLASVIIYGALLLALVWLFIRFAATPFISRIAHSPELLVTFSLAWAALLAALGSHFGFSKELGGLVAGVSLASTPFRESIVSRMASLRDFLLLFFFIVLGMHLELGLLGTQVWPAIVLSAFVLIGNPLIVMVIMGVLGYRKRTGFLAGLTVAQISEFSLVFMAMGLSLGHVLPETLGLVTLVGLITIATSVYMITYSHTLFKRLEPFLGVFERKRVVPEESEESRVKNDKPFDIIVFGLGRFGGAIAENLLREGFRMLVIDFNPDIVRRWKQQGYHALYGDASDQELIASLPLRGVQWVICALSQLERGVSYEDPRLVLIDALKRNGYGGKIAVSTQQTEEVRPLQEVGSDLVFRPYHDAARQAAEQISAAIAQGRSALLE